MTLLDTKGGRARRACMCNGRDGRHSLSGFTLIEVAIVVAIIAVLMTLGLGFLNSQITTNSYLVTKKRAEMIKDALIAYLGAHKGLPCPIPSPTGPVTGDAPPLTGTPPRLGCPAAFGVIPYATLGLSREIAEDGWGNLFSYQVHAESYLSPPQCPGVGVNWANPECFGEGKAGGLNVNDGTDVIATSVVAAIVSHGANGSGAWVVQGTRNVDPTTCEEAQNAQRTITTTPPCSGLPAEPSYVYYKGERPDGNDDVVAYLTAREAMQALSKQGVVKPAAATVSEDLQTLYDQTIGLNLRDCADPFVPPSLAPPNPDYDPWGLLYWVKTVPESPPPTIGMVQSICICSLGPSGNLPDVKCVPPPVTPPAIPGVCKSMDKALFNAYRVKANVDACP